ncbi:WD repeat-containing protein 38 [Ceratobasidium sp. 414]|nr:WD repeat-containing protein 38 [Ceratobasidium sp. 414]
MILPTISYQLACFSRPFRHALSGVLEQNPDVHTRKLLVQFTKLIVQPLLEVQESIPHDLVVVIDALDECDNDDGVGQILDILLGNVSNLPIRFLVTSRPEPDIRDRMLNRSGKRELFELHLHELEESTVREDIKTYLQAKLNGVELPPGDVDLLAERSGVLFLYAATAVRYILADNRSRIVKRLQTVLDVPDSSPRSINKHIDELYTVILQTAFDRNDLDDDEQLEMRLVLGTVICAQEPLTVDQMTRLLGPGQADAIRTAIRPLLSVLNLHRRSELITTLHQSFPDYMLDRNRSMSFYCDAKACHAMLAQRCFELMRVPNPPFNICGLQSSYLRDKDVVDLDDKIQRAISGELRYACYYWGAHILLAEPLPSLIQELDYWVSVRLLLWMEIMNLKQHLIDGAGMLSRVESMKGLAELTGAKELGQDSSLLAICRSEGPLTFIAVAPGGAHIISSSVGNQIYIWDAHTTQKKAQLQQEGIGSVCSAAYSLDGSRIVTGLDDGSVVIWDARSLQKIGEPFCRHTRPVCSVACSPNGSRVASGSRDNTICVWDADTGEIIGNPLEGHTGAVNSVVYSPNGSHIISGSDDKTIRIWNTQTGEMIGEPLQDHTGSVCSIAYSPNGARIASGSKDKTICVRDACTMHIVGKLLYHAGGVNSVAYSPDGAHLISGSDDNTICVWDAQTGQIVGEPLKGHTGIVNSVKYLLGGSRIISASNDKTLRIWDAHGNQKKEKPPVVRTSWWARYRGSGNTADSSADNRNATRLAAEAMSRWIGVIHVHSPNSTHVVSSSNDNSLRVWDTHNHQLVGKPFRGHTDAVCSIAYSPNGARIVSGSKDATIRVWDALTGRMVGKPFEGHTAPVNSVACSPDSTRIVSGSDDNTVCIWEVSTGRVIGRSTGAGAVNSVAFSPDGERIIAGSSGMIVYIRDGRSGRTIGEPLRGHSGAVKSVAFSPDGARIASGSRDCVIRIWDARSGQKMGKPLMGHSAAINSVIFSPDGARIISGSDDKTIRIWDGFTGQMVGNPLTGHAQPVYSISHSLDGAYIVSGSQDLTIRIWDAVAGPPVSNPFND